METPTSINVMGINYQIKFEPSPVDNGQTVWGYTDYGNALIVLQSGMNEQKISQTLIHELTHAMFHEMGNDTLATDEVIVGSFGNVLYQVLKENNLEIN